MAEEQNEEKQRKSLEEREKMSELERIRHSCAHIMATAILRIWPDAQFAYGPPVENGFYYDVELEHRITPEDFAKIEAEMKKEVKANNRFEKSEVTRDQAIIDAKSGRLGGLTERADNESNFKLDLLDQIPEGESISYFQNGDFIDLCAGPHVMRTGNVKAFKLTSVASAYYKGDKDRPQLQRIYGTAFKNKTQLNEYLEMIEEAKKRDHRRIGQEMGLFAMDPDFTGPGLPLWLPKGTVIVEELENLAKETEFQAGYVRVRTPHLAKEKMYKTSGHLPYYAESMFPPMELSETDKVDLTANDGAEEGERTRYYLKAMNCPHHHRIFAAEPRSYRDLPLRMAEYGTCYRYEQSGELFGLMRVRSLNMNDAHVLAPTVPNDSGSNTSTMPICGSRRRTWSGKSSKAAASTMRKFRTKPHSTAPRSTYRYGAPLAANSPSPRTRWISPCRNDSVSNTRIATTPTKLHFASIAPRWGPTNDSSAS